MFGIRPGLRCSFLSERQNPPAIILQESDNCFNVLKFVSWLQSLLGWGCNYDPEWIYKCTYKLGSQTLLPNCTALRDEPRHCVQVVPLAYFFIALGATAHVINCTEQLLITVSSVEFWVFIRLRGRDLSCD